MMNDTSLTTPVTRRGLLLGGAALAGLSLSGCGGGKSAQDAAGGAQSKATFGGSYTGPAITLSYWNGFTGGDGPFMKKMVAEFMADNPKIKITETSA